MSFDESLNWYESLTEDVGYKIEQNKNAFAILLNTLMMDQDISKADLSRLTGKSAPYITKVLRGDTNLTISSMTKLLDAINCDLHINGCHKNHDMKWLSVISSNQAARMTPEQRLGSSLWKTRRRHDDEAA